MSGCKLFRQLLVKLVYACRFTAIFASTSVFLRRIHQLKCVLTCLRMPYYVSTSRYFLMFPRLAPILHTLKSTIQLYRQCKTRLSITLSARLTASSFPVVRW